MENSQITTTNDQSTTGPEFEVLMVGGPENGRLVKVQNVQEEYLFPQISVFESTDIPEDLNTYQVTRYTTITIPRSCSDGSPWFIGVADGMDVDDVITLLFNNYVKSIHG
jgi:hypothetical protein